VHLIEQIGAYAGLAAIPGLAVLSALYFSQARDVKRLREWAGRAPERAAEQASGGRVVAQPQPAVQPAAQTAAQGEKPAAAVTPGAKPAVAGATPAAAAAAAAAAGQAAKPAAATTATPATQEAKPGALTPAAVASAAAKAPAAAAATGAGAATASGANAGSGGTGTVTRTGPPAVGDTRPSSSGAPVARRPIPRITGAQTSVLSPTTPQRDPWYRRLAARLPAPRYIALIVAGALVLGGGAAFGITQLAKNHGGGSTAGSGSRSATKDTGSSKDQPSKDKIPTPAVNPADVTVTVVNGTTIPNLARDTATKLSKLGFQIGNKVTGTGSLAAAESVVEYRPGAAEEARYVAAKLNITQKQPADADALAQAGPAQVIVVLGADQAPGG
jgi:hypothetical protein